MGNKCHAASAAEALEKTKKRIAQVCLKCQIQQCFYGFFVCNARKLDRLSASQLL